MCTVVIEMRVRVSNGLIVGTIHSALRNMNRAISTQQDSTEAQESRAPGAGKKSSPNKGGGRNNGAHRVQVIKPRIENWTDKISYMGKSRTTQTRHGFSKDLNQKNRISSFQKKREGNVLSPSPLSEPVRDCASIDRVAARPSSSG
jgi:DNA-directed RNA polymerase beta subunit